MLARGMLECEPLLMLARGVLECEPLLMLTRGVLECEPLVMLSLAVINECEINNGGCSDICEQTTTGHRCLCSPGYMLDSDQQTCTGELHAR